MYVLEPHLCLVDISTPPPPNYFINTSGDMTKLQQMTTLVWSSEDRKAVRNPKSFLKILLYTLISSSPKKKEKKASGKNLVEVIAHLWTVNLCAWEPNSMFTGCRKHWDLWKFLWEGSVLPVFLLLPFEEHQQRANLQLDLWIPQQDVGIMQMWM